MLNIAKTVSTSTNLMQREFWSGNCNFISIDVKFEPFQNQRIRKMFSTDSEKQFHINFIKNC
jgi:hypothetical protein